MSLVYANEYTVVCLCFYYRIYLFLFVSYLVTDIAASGFDTKNCSSEPSCRCFSISKDNIRADCSYVNLMKFPTFTEDVVEINFSHNGLTSIAKGTKLPKGVKHLDISHCQLRIIEIGFIRSLQHLEYLDISHNRELTLNDLPNVTFDLQFTNIKTFKFNALQCKFGDDVIFRHRHVRHLRNTSLLSVSFSSNRISIVERGVLADFPETLENGTARDNRFTINWNYTEISTLKNLKFADISSTFTTVDRYLSYFEMDGCDDSRPSGIDIEYEDEKLLPRASTAVNITYGSCMPENMGNEFPLFGNLRVIVFICMPPSLETLIFSNSSLTYVHAVKRVLFDLRNIKTLVSSGNLKTVMRGSLLSNKTSHVDLSDNLFSDIHPLFFKPANLSYLDLSKNYLGNLLRHENSTDLLKEQTFLKTLGLSRNNILQLPHRFLDPFVRLEMLDLSDNFLQEITFSLKRLSKLKQLNLRKNRLNILSHATIHELEDIAKYQRLVIDLSENDILCSCNQESLDFLRWILRHSEGSDIEFKDVKTYSCTFPNSTRDNFSDLQFILSWLEKECASYTGVIIACVMAATVALITVSAGVVYRYRWRLRYMYYMAKRSYRGNVRTQHGNYRNMFNYDAFVSHSSDDREVALHNFLEHIESQGLKLCFHERDFIPGFDIAENIANAIHESRKVVCVLSKSFLTSSWCMYEFNMALMERIHRPDGENMLFLVRLKDFDVKKAPLTMLQFIRDTTYATDEYPDDTSSQAMFWTKIADTINMD